MNLFIRVVDGHAVDHPILDDNFRAAFPNVDVQNLPSEFARFKRVEPPSIGVYEVYEGVTYEPVGDGFTDVHHVRQMTEDEVLSKQAAVKALWAEHGFLSWVFNAATCSFESPVPYPTDGQFYIWDEGSTSWVKPPNA